MTRAERLADLGYAAGWRLVRRLPERLAAPAFTLAGELVATRRGRTVRQLRANLARVVPQAGAEELDELSKHAMRSYARYWHEAFRLPAMDHADVARRFGAGLEGVDNFDAALRAGNGVVVALPHSGNWDVAGVWLARTRGQFTTVAERLRPESLYQRFVDYRESLGFEILPLTGDTSTTRLLMRRLRDNGVVCLLADRDLTRSGVDVTFFGETARMPAGPAWLAAATGATLLPMTTWFTDDGWGGRFHPRVRVDSRNEIPAATQLVADVLAGDIASHPADWHMLQKLWLADLAADDHAAGTATEDRPGADHP